MASVVTPRLTVSFLWENAIPGLRVFLLCVALTFPACFRTGFSTCCKKGVVLGMAGASG